MEHGRVYPNSEESERRFRIFQKNLKHITETNANRSNSSPYGIRLGLNKFADMSPEEFKLVYLRPLEIPTTIAPATSRSDNQTESCEAPDSMDWRQKDAVTPAKNQLKCGSCWAFGTVGAIESMHAIKRKELISLSEQELVHCDSMSQGCSGGSPKSAYEWVIRNGGLVRKLIILIKLNRIIAEPPCGTVKINGYDTVAQSDAALLRATAKQPITVVLYATDIQFYKGGIIDVDTCPTQSRPNHAVLMVGYDSKEGTDYWIVKNSWGEDWGMEGYFLIRRNTDLPYGVTGIALYIPHRWSHFHASLFEVSSLRFPPDHSASALSSKEEEQFRIFQQWTEEHGKIYPNSEESEIRYQTFRNNLKYITETNAKRPGYRLGLNKFADMSPEEFKRVYLRQLPTPTTTDPKTTAATTARTSAVTPVKNQKECGCCWAFGTVGAIESIHAIKTGELISLSEQQLLDCDTVSQGCSGGFTRTAFEYVIRNDGISEENSYPYEDQQGTCRANMQNGGRVVKISSYTKVQQSDDALLCATAQQPITVSMDATYLQFYKEGIFEGENCEMGSTYTNHAVLIVGYGSQDGKDYWTVKNSWGQNWGQNGYFFITRNTNSPTGVCAINTNAYFPSI
ncbi:P34 probable thiol protease-like [Prosopis cineraria]|uniref:P34 probable thiol protease-like n=1 Tax=Prosopis cineraria TaxID=364024 RepID=UPI0024102B31|nr:P34 probable thiol protease-like [Prosopis cineraria]